MDEADQYSDQVGLMQRGRIRALGTQTELREGLGARRRAEGAADSDPVPTLEDVFRDIAGSRLDESSGDFRDVRSARRTARCVG